MTKFELWSVWGQWFSAIATIAAVVVALWSVTQSNKTKFKMKFLLMDNQRWNPRLLILDTGSRSIVISQIIFYCGKDIMTIMDYFEPSFRYELNQTIIRSGEKANISFMPNYLIHEINHIIGSPNKDNIKTIYVELVDFDGNRKKIKTNYKLDFLYDILCKKAKSSTERSFSHALHRIQLRKRHYKAFYR